MTAERDRGGGGGGAKLIAFYLPQYHPIPENDRWWGKGFTEWTNVASARPRFRGHHQPHLPSDLGFYDLRVPEAREAQAELARSHGIDGFCYYHYWFNGKRLLERPFDEVLATGSPELPFCLCWANENWTRAWNGGDRDILIAQNYSDEDDRHHIRHLLRALEDRRYIRIAGKPLLLVYRTEIMPNPARTAEIWREEARIAGVGDLYLARVESFTSDVDPTSIGFDAAVEFAPDWRNRGRRRYEGRWGRLAVRLGLVDCGVADVLVHDYDELVERMVAKDIPEFRRFRCVTPGFDNTPRRRTGGLVFLGSSPDKYEKWLRQMVEQTTQHASAGERIVFVNAWNEWGEGNHLEPDLRWQRAYLEATKRVMTERGTE